MVQCPAEKIQLTDSIRAKLPGSFVALSQGVTHYELGGKDTQDLVVLVHGFSSPLMVWDLVFPHLIQQNFQVLRFDLYGRGVSDRPDIAYSIENYILQLEDLLKALKLDQKSFNLVGLSMGGIIVSRFTQKHPNLIKKLILVDPAGFPSNASKPPGFLKIPGIGKFFFKLIGNSTLLKGTDKNFNRPERLPDFSAKFAEQMNYIGFNKAMFKVIINVNLEVHEDAFKAVGQTQIPVLLFWGRQDQTIFFENSEKVRKVIPTLQFEAIDDCGHMPNLEQPELFNKKLVEFLQK